MLAGGPCGVGVSLWSGGGFNPGSFGTLIAAYEADYGITLNGSTVAAWAPKWWRDDLSQVTLTLAQATAANQPLYSANRGDGRPCVAPQGTNDYMENAAVATALSGSTAYTVVLAASYPSTSTQRIVQCANATLAERAFDFIDLSATAVASVSVGGAVAYSALTKYTGIRTTSLRRSGTSVRYRADAQSVDFACGAAGVVPTMLTLGASYGGAFAGVTCVSAMWIYSSAADEAFAAMQARWPNYG